MNFNLKSPCKDCPFLVSRKFPLPQERKAEIALSLLNGDNFPCHKTVDYSGEEPHVPASAEHCAGAMIALEKINRPNQLMRIAERLGLYDRRTLDLTVPVHRLDKWLGLRRRL